MSLGTHHARLSQIDLGSGEGMGRLTAVVQKRLSPYVFSRLRDSHAAEDVLQETLLTMIEHAHALQRPECFWPWIYRVARRKIQDHFRRQERWAAAKQHARHETECRFRAVYGQIDGLERIIAAERAQRLSDAIVGLGARQRQLVHLRCFEQAPYRRIAVGTRMSAGQARINLHRAKLHLRKRLHALSA